MGRRLSLDNAAFVRASDAFNPYTGEWVREHVLRRAPSKVRVLKRPFKASDLITFEPGITRMSYAQLLTRMASFEATVGLRAKPTGSITCVAGSAITNGHYFILDDGLNVRSFYFDKGSATPPPTNPVQIDIDNGMDEDAVAQAVLDAIEQEGMLISAVIDHSTASEVVLLTHDYYGTDGNISIDDSNLIWGGSITGMSGGTSGFLTKNVIGQSTGGEDIVCYSYGDELLPGILFITGVHGNEVDGTEGMFRYLETLHARRNGAWKPILNEHHIRWVVSANPDGWISNLRNLQGVGPNGQTVNLNRQFPWFWPPYIESSAESKGVAPAGSPGAEPEAQALFQLIAGPTPGNISAVFDHHQNIGQGHRYLSRNRVNSYAVDGIQGAGFNKDWDVHRATGAIRNLRSLETGEPESLFVQFRRSKNVPHLHSWASGIGKIAMALESRKDEPEGATGSCKWMFDSTLACCVSMTEAWWKTEDVVLIERAATNLVTGQEAGWMNWDTGGAKMNGYSKSRVNITRLKDQQLFPINGRVSLKLQAELAVDPLEVTPEWKLGSIGDVVIGFAPRPSIPGDLQTMILATETVDTGPGATGASVGGGVTGYGVALINPNFAAFAVGGWDAAGDLWLGGTYADAFNPGLAGVGGAHAFDAGRADMGFANDGARYSVFVGGVTQPTTGPFAGTVDGKIYRYDLNTNTMTDTGLTVPARKHALVVHQPGTDKFWIFGGEDNAGNQLNTIHVYDRAAGTVTEHGTTLPFNMSRIAGAAYKTDTIFLYGGRKGGPGTHTTSDKVYQFTPSSGALVEVTVLANIEDEASHDETPFALKWYGMSAARRVSGNGEEIFIAGGKVGEVGAEADQEEFYVHRPGSNTITHARDGLYSLLSKQSDIAVTPGEWVSISCMAKTVTPIVQDKPPYFRACLTFKNSSGTWVRHARTYYEAPWSHEWQEFRTASPVKAGEASVRPYLRLYVDQAQIMIDRWMVCKRSRPSTFHYGTRADEKLTFSESINMDNFRVEFTWSPTFGFVNVGEDLELARVEKDATNYVSLVLIQDTGKTYHSGNSLVGAQYPKVELRKYVSGLLTKTVQQTLDYGYDGRSSNQEAYNDPTRFGIEHSALGGLALTVERYGQIARVEDREFDNAYGVSEPGYLVYEGEGQYGIPELKELRRRDPRVDSSSREFCKLAGDTRFSDVSMPGWANAT